MKQADIKKKKDEIRAFYQVNMKSKKENAEHMKVELAREQASIKRHEQFVNKLKEIEQEEKRANVRAYKEDLNA